VHQQGPTRTKGALITDHVAIQPNPTEHGTLHPVLTLQRMIGNRAVQRILRVDSDSSRAVTDGRLPDPTVVESAVNNGVGLPGASGVEGRGGSNCSTAVQRQEIDDVDPTGPTSYPPGHVDTELPGGGDLINPQIPQAPKVPEIPEPPPGGFPELPPGASMAGEGAAEGGEAAAAGLGAEAVLPLTLAAAAGVGTGIGMANLADSDLTKTGAFGVNQDTGKNQSAMDWGANWGTDWDKAHNNGEASITGGVLAGAGGIVGGIGGALYGAGNFLFGDDKDNGN
jgi:hypothetical protein